MQLPALTSVQLGVFTIFEEHLEELAALPTLQRLHLADGYMKWSFQNSTALAELTSLRELELHGRGFLYVDEVAQSLSALIALSLLALGAGLFEGLSHIPHEALQLGSALASSLAHMPKMRRLLLEEAVACALKGMSSAFGSLTALQHLQLRRCKLCAEWAQAASQVTTLQSLVLRRCTEGTMPAQFRHAKGQHACHRALACLAQSNPHLTQLNFRGSFRPGRDGLDDWEPGRRLAATLATLLHLQKVDVSKNGWGPCTTLCVVERTRSLPELRSIKLSAEPETYAAHRQMLGHNLMQYKELMQCQMPDASAHLARCQWLQSAVQIGSGFDHAPEVPAGLGWPVGAVFPIRKTLP